MRISYDPKKRAKTFDDREIDFDRAVEVFQGPTAHFVDGRKDYGERRVACYGFLDGRLVVVCYTERDGVRHVFSMRKANEREQKKVRPYFQNGSGEV